jgi:polyisoprenyl-phosphate glycosyltransferase
MTLEISVVIPVYRGEKALPELVERLAKTLDAMGRSYEVIFVDDRSPDDSWRVLKELKAGGRPWMKLVRLLKNAGQHNALICGLGRATGKVVVTMDDDLQHPPEELPKLVAPIDEGFDLVIGAFENQYRKGLGSIGGRAVDTALRRIFALPSDFKLTSWRAMRHAVAAQAAQMTGAYPYVTAMVLSHATALKNVDVAFAPRAHGSSNYNFLKSVRLALNLVINYSSYPLYLMAILCAISMLAFVGISGWTLYVSIGSETVPGWASTLLTLTFSNAIITTALLVLFMYVARISHQIGRTRVSHTIEQIDG